MDYAKLIEIGRGLAGDNIRHPLLHSALHDLCDAVEALERDANRWRWYATSPQTALMLGSKLDPNSEQDWVAENGRLADIIMRDAFYQAIEASTPTPAAPSDA